MRHGALCYLDEVVEARQDTTVVIHPLTDARRVLPLEKRNELIPAHPDFQLIISYNPGYQSAVKDLEESTKQRFIGLDFSYPVPELEAQILVREAGIEFEHRAIAWCRSARGRAICADRGLMRARRPAC